MGTEHNRRILTLVALLKSNAVMLVSIRSTALSEEQQKLLTDALAALDEVVKLLLEAAGL